MNSPAEPPRRGSRTLLFVLIGVAGVLGLVILLVAGAGIIFYGTKHSTAARKNPTGVEARDFSQASSVTYAAAIGSEQGLAHLDQEPDGTTSAFILQGRPTRTESLTGTRTTVNFYFTIDPSFKQAELRHAVIEVEYFAPFTGTMGVHYDAADIPGLEETGKSKRAYKEASRPVTLVPSNAWQVATFTARDAAFANRQNGGADFRLWAKTPTLHIGRVTVTRLAKTRDDWPGDLSRTNSVQVAMGQETPLDGLHHLSEQGDGRTTVTNLNGVLCRHLSREGRGNGFIYFTIHPSFKAPGLTNAWCEIEYLNPSRATVRIQYDAAEFDTHRPYKSASMAGTATLNYGGSAVFSQISGTAGWRTGLFHLTDAVFANSQNGGADFRLEVSPPDLYVRRVTLHRDRPPPPTVLNQPPTLLPGDGP